MYILPDSNMYIKDKALVIQVDRIVFIFPQHKDKSI